MPPRCYGDAVCIVCAKVFDRKSSRSVACPPCRPIAKKQRLARNIEARRATIAARIAADPEGHRAKLKDSYLRHREARIASAKERYLRIKQEDHDALKAYHNAYRRRRRAAATEEDREKLREYLKRRRSSPRESLNIRIGNAVREAVRGRKGGCRWEALVGYSLDELVAHLERQFTRGMSWENMGEWHIDHITPLASFTFKSADCAEFKAAWAITNLRPLWASENMSKGARITRLL